MAIKRCTLYGLEFLLLAPQAGSKLLAMFHSQVDSKINFTKRRNMVIRFHISAVNFSAAHIWLNIFLFGLRENASSKENISFRLALNEQ